MSSQGAYSWTLLRVVPRIERGERMNVGAAVYCRRKQYLGLGYVLDQARLLALDPALDLTAVRHQLAGLERVAAGDSAAGRVAGMDAADRFGFIAAPSSTVLQASAVHVGLCTGDPAAMLDDILTRYVHVAALTGALTGARAASSVNQPSGR
jgi:hypothetical protein